MNYIGTTGLSMHVRSKNHLEAIKKGDQKNAMAKHVTKSHLNDSEIPTFTMKPISNHIHTLNRYTAECIYIEKQIKDLSMNCKTEWGRGKKVRISLETIRS